MTLERSVLPRTARPSIKPRLRLRPVRTDGLLCHGNAGIVRPHNFPLTSYPFEDHCIDVRVIHYDVSRLHGGLILANPGEDDHILVNNHEILANCGPVPGGYGLAV